LGLWLGLGLSVRVRVRVGVREMGGMEGCKKSLLGTVFSVLLARYMPSPDHNI
jgi:hypothetical protein